MEVELRTPIVRFLTDLTRKIELGECYDEAEIPKVQNWIEGLNQKCEIFAQGFTSLKFYLLDLSNFSEWTNNGELWECIGSVVENESLAYEAEREAEKARVDINIELSERKLTQLGMETNADIYELAKTKNADALQEIYNRGYISLRDFGDSTGANRWGEFNELEDYMSTFPNF